MAKDGTLRGGSRAGSGSKRKPLAEKIAEGNPGKRKLTVLEFPDTADLKGNDMPKPAEYLTEEQHDGSTLQAEELYIDTWNWLKGMGCEKLVSKSLIDRYAMAVARNIQCEQAITKYGMLSKHPTTGKPIQSPYVAMAQTYSSEADRLWMAIFQVVKDNCAAEYNKPTPADDAMEMLLQARAR